MIGMQSLQPITDKCAIGLSMACAIHCLLTPFLLVTIPSISVLGLDNELFHVGMAVLVIPTSIISLTIGCRAHKHYRLFAYSIVGLLLLISALFLHDIVGEVGEKIMTIIGAGFIAYSHYLNFRLCQAHHDCHCEDSK